MGGTTGYEHLNLLVEDGLVGNAPAMTAERVVDIMRQQQHGVLAPAGLDAG
jgi:hypothetical protein